MALATRIGITISSANRLLVEALHRECAAFLHDSHVFNELGCLAVSVERCLVGPSLDDAEHILTRGTLECVVCDAASVLLRFCNQCDGGFQRLLIFSGLGLEETIQSNHSFVFKGLYFGFTCAKLVN